MTLQIVILINFCFQLIVNMTRPVLTLFASDLGASTLEIGVLTAAYSFVPLFIAIHAGKIADKIGDRLPIFFGMIGIAGGMILPYLFPTMWALYASQVIVGIAHIFVALCLQNILGHWAPHEKRDHYFGIFATSVSVAAVAGPVTGGYIIQHFTFGAAFFTGFFISLIPILVSLWIPKSKGRKVQEKISLAASLSLLKRPTLRKALISSALVLYSRDIFVAYFPLYGQDLGMSASTIGWILSIQGFAMVIVRTYLAKLVTSFGRDQILLYSIALAGVAFLLVPFTGQTVLLGVWSALMGFGLGIGQPLSMTTTYNASPKSRTGEVLGLRLMTNRVSQLIAPVLFGLVGTWVGVISVFYLSGAFLLGGIFAVKSGKEQNSTMEPDPPRGF